MGLHVTKYKTESGKTRKVKGKNGAADKPVAGDKNQPPASPAKQGA
jgi:hypothetical protein